jgi:hypothetical protein
MSGEIVKKTVPHDEMDIRIYDNYRILTSPDIISLYYVGVNISSMARPSLTNKSRVAINVYRRMRRICKNARFKYQIVV